MRISPQSGLQCDSSTKMNNEWVTLIGLREQIQPAKMVQIFKKDLHFILKIKFSKLCLEIMETL